MAIEVPVCVSEEDDAVVAIERVALPRLIADLPNNFAVPFPDHPTEVDRGVAQGTEALHGNLNPARRHSVAVDFPIAPSAN